jgi:arylsulfatase A-like enzyme
VQISEAQVGRAVRTQRWKYSVSAPDKNGGKDPASDHSIEEFLYDLEADPYELTNLIGWDAYDGVKANLRERLLRRVAEVEKAHPTIELAPTQPSGQRKVLPEELNA